MLFIDNDPRMSPVSVEMVSMNKNGSLILTLYNGPRDVLTMTRISVVRMTIDVHFHEYTTLFLSDHDN